MSNWQEVVLLDRAQELYMGALNCCLQGNMEAADEQLSKLGCTWRLSQPVWQEAASTTAPALLPTSGSDPQDRGASPVLVCDQPLPHELLASLKAAFHSPSADFWDQHAYNQPDTPFFSYLIDLKAARAKAAEAVGSAVLGAPQDNKQQQQPLLNVLEVAALLLQQQLQEAVGTAAAAGCLSTQAEPSQPAPPAAAAAVAATAVAIGSATHVEWWAHTRPPWAPHQLHFDAAESAFRRGLGPFRLVHPLISSLVFLSGCGGPTLVLQQDSSGAVEAADTWQQQQQQQPIRGLKHEQQEHGPEAAAGQGAAAGPSQQPPSKRAKLADEVSQQGMHDAKQQQQQEQQGLKPEADQTLLNHQQAHPTQQHQHHHHHTQHDHHRRHHHHKHHQSPPPDQQGSHHELPPHPTHRPMLAASAALIHPHEGRVALWPGNLLHGVLPAHPMPACAAGLDEDEDGGGPAAAGGGIPPESAAPASAAESEVSPGARTTLILAWWDQDPRQLVARNNESDTAAATAAACEVHGGPGQWDDDPLKAAAGAARGHLDAEGAAGGHSSNSTKQQTQPQEQQQQQQLGPCMSMPELQQQQQPPNAAHSSAASSNNPSGASIPAWLQALLLPQDKLKSFLLGGTRRLSAAACSNLSQLADTTTAGTAVSKAAGAGAAAPWHLLPVLSPAWEPVVQQQGVQQARTAQDHIQTTPPAAASGVATVRGTSLVCDKQAVMSPRQQQQSEQQLEQQQQQEEGDQSAADLLCVELPCLRFFLRDVREIRAAYIPALEAWSDPDD